MDNERDLALEQEELELELAIREKENESTGIGLPQSVGEAVDKAKTAYFEGFDVSEGVQKAAQVAETGLRAGRAAGVAAGQITDVGAPNLLNLINPAAAGQAYSGQQLTQMGQNIPGALARGKEAFQPGFKPEEGRESTFSDLGEIGAAMLQTYPILALGSKNPAVTGGLTFGAMEAIKQAARDGRIVPSKVVKEGAINAALPSVVPAAQYISTAVKNTLKGILTKTAKVPEKAIEIALDNPRLLEEFSGAGEAIRKETLRLQDAIINSRQKAGGVLEKVQKRVGVWKDPKAPIGKTVEKSAEHLDEEFRQLTGEILPRINNSDAKLKLVYKLREDIKGALKPPKPGTTLQPISDFQSKQLMDRKLELDALIESLPFGKRLRMAEKGFSEVAKVYDELQTTMSTPGKAEQLMERLFKGENVDEMIGSKKSTIDLLKRLEKKEGVKIIDPLFSQFSSRAFKSLEPKGFSGSILAGVAAVLAVLNKPALAAGAAVASSPRGAFELVKRAKQVGGVVKKAADVIATPAARSLIGGQQLFTGEEE